MPICVEVIKKKQFSNSAYIKYAVYTEYAVNKSLIELHSLFNELQ